MSEGLKSFTVVVRYSDERFTRVWRVISIARGREDWLELKTEDGTEVTFRPTWESVVQYPPGVVPEEDKPI